MAETMIERVARAIDPFSFKSWQMSYDYEMGQSGDPTEAKEFADWSMGKKLDEARANARATLEAIRVPDDAMKDAGCEVGPDTNSGQFGYDDAARVYTAMIDAALTQA